MPTRKEKWPVALITSFALLLPVISMADMSEADYQSALRTAEKKIARNISVLSLNPQTSSALSPSTVHGFMGRDYQVGDQWDVAAWTADNAMARMTSDPERLGGGSGRGGIFHYQVIAVKNRPSPEVTLQVTQLENFGLKKSDPRVENLQLVFTEANAGAVQNKKTYQMKTSTGRVRTVSVASEGLHSTITPMELFPLDVPELATAEKLAAPTAFPTLPAKLQTIAQQTGYHPDPAKCTAYEQDDFYGRRMQIFWQQGDLWPTYLKTDNGVAILIRSGSAAREAQ